MTLALIATCVVLALYLIKFEEATSLIENQEREIEQQRDLINQKKTFGAAMEKLLTSATLLDGTLMSTLVPTDHIETLASSGWLHRWKPELLDRDIAAVATATTDLEGLVATASVEASTNMTNSTYETVIDELGGGFARTTIDDADTLCEADVLACVVSDDPYLVHFDAADTSLPYMVDWLRTGLAYHEFAHVLQMTNPVPTEVAAAAFGGDHETMADCFALTFLPGWTLDHEVWTSEYEYWEASIGYGYTCNAEQMQAVRDWHGQLGYTPRPISQ